jgi:hypothetical protein
MQTYAVVDSDFKFVKIGKTGDLDARLSALNTASPRPLILMALADTDIERSMHLMLDEHRERLEWFRYNDDTEFAIITRMTPTPAWAKARKALRKEQQHFGRKDALPALPVARLNREQRDRLSGLTGKSFPLAPGSDALGEMYGIPDEKTIMDVIDRAQKSELLQMRRALSACGQRARAECEVLKDRPLSLRATQAAFALQVIKNWKRRVGMEIGSLHRPPSLTLSPDYTIE